MSDMDITPASLEAHADWIDGTGHGPEPGAALRSEAARIRRERDRIDELAALFWIEHGRAKGNTSGTSWDGLYEESRESFRVGIRAVLAKLEQEETEYRERPCGRTRPYGDPFLCSLREGHSGSHEAWVGLFTNRELCATWDGDQ
jgi:hypothetical protein